MNIKSLTYFLSMISLKKFFYLFLPVKGLCCCMDFSLVAESGGNTLVVMCKFLIVVASLVAEHVP